MNEDRWARAVQVETMDEADYNFSVLLNDVIQSEDAEDYNHALEITVSNLVYCAGYYDEKTKARAVELYVHRSPYRNGTIKL